MERRVPSLLYIMLLCVTVCTAYGASLLTHDGGSSAASAAQARPLVNKGKTILKYVVKLRPTKRNGKVVGDAGASGKMLLKAVKYNANAYRVVIKYLLLNLKGGGLPGVGFASSCFVASFNNPPWVNITKDGSRKRYSFMFNEEISARTEDSARDIANDFVREGSSYGVVAREGNQFALCGKVVTKVK